MIENIPLEQQPNNEQMPIDIPSAQMPQNPVLVAVSVGDILFVEIFERNKPNRILECKVLKVGKKYGYIKIQWQEVAIGKFSLLYESKNGFSNNIQAYRNKQDILDRQEKEKLIKLLNNYCNWNGKIKNNSLNNIKSACHILGLL